MSLPASGLAVSRTSVPSSTLAERLAVIQRVAQVGLWEMRVSDRRMFVSDETRVLFGIAPDAPAPDVETLLACVHPDDLDYVEQQIDHALQHGTALDLTHRLVCDHGTVRHVHSRTSGSTRMRCARAKSGSASWHASPATPSGTSTSRPTPCGSAPTCASCSATPRTISPPRSRCGWTASIRMTGRGIIDRFGAAVHASRDVYWSDDYRFIRKDGSIAYVHDQAQIVRDSEGRALRVVGAVIDVSARHEANARIREQASLLDQAKDAIVVAGLDRRIRYWNHGAERLYGKSSSAALGTDMGDFLYADDEALAEALRTVLACGEWRGEMLGRRSTGSMLPVEAQWTLVHDELGQAQSIFAINTDITERKASERHVRHLAFHDALTGLPNRHLLTERLQAAMAASRDSASFSALMLIDLDNFKTLNDTLGHAVGDRLLQEMARRLQAGCTDTTTVARFGGDEFAVLLNNLGPDKQHVCRHAHQEGDRIIRLLSQPFQLDGYRLQPGASIGVTVFVADADNADDLVKRADMAMYRAKAAGRGTVRFFAPALQAAAAARLALESDLREALHNHAFFLHYQPQVGLGGRIVGVEALVRWRHPARGLVSPAEFIPVAEDIGLALPLGHWVLENACRQLAAWAKGACTAHLEVAVNVSARQLHHPAFVAQVLDCLDRSGAAPDKLKLEITEGTLLDDIDDAIQKINALRARGLIFAIDDFGTGYSSLAYLKRLPLDMLKIDRSFVLDLNTNPNDAVIARTIVALGASLGLKVLAEGVETRAQRDFLFESGCQAYQGYLCAKPMPPEDVERLLCEMDGAHWPTGRRK